MSLVYIVEDDQNIREIETFSLKSSGYSVVDFETAQAFFAQLEEQTPDLILLDIMLPDMDGLEIIKCLRRKSSTRKIPIILVTAKSKEVDKVKGLDAGADDYLTKPFGVMELIARVKALLRRSGEEEEYLILDAIRIDDGKHAVYVNGALCELTYKEYELLKLLVRNAGTVMSRDIIMERIWGIDFEGESRTLDMHIKTLRKKLGAAGGKIKTVRNVGYLID